MQGAFCGLQAESRTCVIYMSPYHPPGEVSGVTRGPTAGILPQAKTSGKFSRDELDKLWREFQHHREKVREYDAMLEALSRTEGAPPRVSPFPGPQPASLLGSPSGRGAVTDARTPVRDTCFSGKSPLPLLAAPPAEAHLPWRDLPERGVPSRKGICALGRAGVPGPQQRLRPLPQTSRTMPSTRPAGTSCVRRCYAAGTRS